jgi:Flp pilus assembly protein TadD
VALAARIALGLVALLLAAWLAVEAIGADAETEVRSIAFAGTAPSAAARARADTLLTRVERLNPDQRPELYRAVLQAREGDRRGALRTLQAATRAEPQNLEAWALLASAARGYDAPLAARATARARELAPPVRR